ncbi:hypothetical protein [Chitinophaga japonensis]|uniref:Uncharacterized protein n=1 Tax=Chitinophaga japonensis TaxID=104662 RepID=A0A562SY86_CHIJA|nr:hypothetical protein [Chitinophaga japonensis]TWI86325.1 hypothetical protein LX66_3579 [Chitinophaga japonensis]
MQIEKFYKAQAIRKDITELETVASGLDGDNTDLKALDKLPATVRQMLNKKAAEVVKRELNKIIREKEKEFNDL